MLAGISEGKLGQGLAREGKPGADRAKADLKKAAPKTEKNSMEPPQRGRDKYDRGDVAGPGPKQKDSTLVPPTPRAGDDARPYRSMLDARTGGASVVGGSTTNAAQILQREEEKDKASETIAEQLKLFYLRAGGPHDASSSLHLHGERGAWRPLSLGALNVYG